MKDWSIMGGSYLNSKLRAHDFDEDDNSNFDEDLEEIDEK